MFFSDVLNPIITAFDNPSLRIRERITKNTQCLKIVFGMFELAYEYLDTKQGMEH